MIWTIRRPVMVGLLTCLVLFFGIFVWGARASLSGAVVATGQVAVESRRQVVQHPDGGVVEGLLVSDGDQVVQGQVLLVLDDAELLSQRAIFAGQLLELRAQAARLKAERDDLPEIAFPDGLEALGTPEAVEEVRSGQSALFTARLKTLEETGKSYAEQKLQVENEIGGLRAQEEALRTQIELNASELSDVEDLFKKGLVEAVRVTALRREAARLQGSLGEAEATVARNLGRIAQLDVEQLQLRAERREKAVGELREVEARAAGVQEQLNAVETRLRRLELRAPMAGIIHDLRVHTIGSVIRPADPVLFVIPKDADLTVLAHIDIYHIDSVHIGQAALLRFSAFDTRTTPEVAATVLRLSPDVTVDERTGAQFYTAELRADERAALPDKPLLPGMPVEVYIQTGERSPLSYLLKPFTDYFNRAFRE
ncbi:MAG: HlyD family type I secretion periplasmic adaptor subunit [Paracoccaceae bacterium]